ncbi:MAG: T9SS type A sorting domain-containing protein [Candidatus Zixiibacteriota bacterium]|nr:MAG: T9SS type A sorting domain-containing protein [candidate division Zixibacteria bacterium]
MRRTFIIILLLLTLSALMVTTSVFGETGWVSLAGASSPERPVLEVISSDRSETIVKVTLAGFNSEERTIEGETYQVLGLPGHLNSLAAGKPQMPIIATLIGVPGSANVIFSVVDSRHVTLPGYNIYPHQITPGVLEIDPAVYSQNALYPSARAEVGEPGIWRDLRVVSLRVNPFQFNPVTGDLIVCPQITVRLSYGGTSNVNVKSPSNRPITGKSRKMYRDAVLNFDQMDLECAVGSDASGVYDMLIIAADDYVDDMAPFVEHKTNWGITTKVMPVSEAGASEMKIAEAISTEYFASGFEYLLLVGNETDIPGPIHNEGLADFSYTLIDGADAFPEIAVGRFSVDNADHLASMIRKTINYEANPPQNDWLKKACLISDCYGSIWPFLELSLNIENADITANGTYSVLYPEFTTCNATHEYLGADEAVNADVFEAINAGQRMVTYVGLGDVLGWPDWNMLDENFFAEEIAQLSNGDMTPIVTSFASLTANLLDDRKCMGEVFTHDEYGAVAYLGRTTDNKLDVIDITAEWYYSQLLYAAIFDEEYNSMGDAFMRTVTQLEALFGEGGGGMIGYYILLGDPTMEVIYDLQPAPPAPVIISPDSAYSFDMKAPVTLSWTEVAEAISYTVEINDDYAFRNEPLMFIEGVEGTEFTFPETPPEGRYHWRVRAHTETRYSVWSEGSVFYVGVAVGVPSLLFPTDGAVLENSPDLEFKFTRVIGPDILAYWVNFYDDPECTNLALGGYLDKFMCRGKDCTFPLSYAAYGLPAGTVYWRVKAIGELGDNFWPYSEVWSFTLTDPIDEAKPMTGIPASVELKGNYPNPFNPATGISFGIPKTTHVRLEIFNIMGRRVATVVDETMSAGYHNVTWDGSKVGSGVYLYRLTADNKTLTKKMLLVK